VFCDRHTKIMGDYCAIHKRQLNSEVSLGSYFPLTVSLEKVQEEQCLFVCFLGLNVPFHWQWVISGRLVNGYRKWSAQKIQCINLVNWSGLEPTRSVFTGSVGWQPTELSGCPENSTKSVEWPTWTHWVLPEINGSDKLYRS
jgi:hypothetical protein